MKSTILIVEDEPLGRLFLERTFQERTDFVVRSAKDGETAVQLSYEQAFTAVIADIGLPGIDGIEAARRILARQDAVLIFLSGNSDPGTMERAVALQPYAIRTKPVDIEGLLALCAQAVDDRTSQETEYLSPGFLLDTLYDTADIGMCVTDAERRFVKVNRAYRETYQYSVEELIGHEFTKVLPQEDRAAAAKMHDDFIDGSVVEMPQDWRVQRKDGEVRDIFVTAGRMIGNDGHPYKVTTVTDRHRNESQLEEALKQKEILLREVHHRVKNNLNTLASIISLQQNHAGAHSEVLDALGVVMNRIRAISSVYERLHQSGDSVQIDLQEYVSGLVNDIVAGAEHSGELSVDVEAAPVQTNLDKGVTLGLMVNELVTNSIKHGSPPGSALSITVKLTVSDANFVIDVSDTGRGLPEGFQPHQANSLGIQLLQALTGQHGGTLAVVDHATAHFRVTIPATDEV